MGIRHFYVFPHVALSTSYKSQCCQRPTSQMRTLRLKEAKEIIVKNFPNMGKEIVNQIQETQRNPYRIN